MDLGFARREWQRQEGPLATAQPALGLPILLAGLACRQMTSPTALAQAELNAPTRLSDPTIDGLIALFGQGIGHISGSFNPAVAAALTGTKPT